MQALEFFVYKILNWKMVSKIFPRIAGPVVDLFVSLECIFHDESECCNLDLYLENFMKMFKKNRTNCQHATYTLWERVTTFVLYISAISFN